MIRLFLLLLLSTTLHAQVFVTDKAEAEFNFNGNVIKHGFNSNGAASITSPGGKRFLRIVFEVKDFRFSSDFEYSEFNEEFMESRYFPQIRISGDIPSEVNFSKNGLYEADLSLQFTMRQIPKKRMIKVIFLVNDKEVVVKFKDLIKLNEYQIPYAGTGSDIGAEAFFLFRGILSSNSLN